MIQNDNFNDLHSLHIARDALCIVSTRNVQPLKRDLATGNTSVIADFDPAAWVSGGHCWPDDIWLCCHEVRRLDPTAQGGGVFSIGRGRKVLDGLLRPHSLISYRDGSVVLDSGNARVVYFDLDGIKQACQLHGFRVALPLPARQHCWLRADRIARSPAKTQSVWPRKVSGMSRTNASGYLRWRMASISGLFCRNCPDSRLRPSGAAGERRTQAGWRPGGQA